VLRFKSLNCVSGESNSKGVKDEIKSKHTKTSLTRLEKSTVKSTKPTHRKSEAHEEHLDQEEEEEEEEGDEEERGIDSVETSMQTDVTLVPLINSTRGLLEDDLDSGIAMGEERNKRLTHLTNKKSIFTIAYDDVGIQKIRATSASPVS